MSCDFRQTAELFRWDFLKLNLLQKDRRKKKNNPLKINCVRNKIADLRTIIQNLHLDYLVLSGTKLFKYGADEIEIKIVVVLLILLEGGIICKSISDFERFSECICFELTISKNKWLCLI